MSTAFFTRDTDRALIGGVCAGIARELHIDPIWVRVVATIATLATSGIVGAVYLVAWIAFPPGQHDNRRAGVGELAGEARDATGRLRRTAGIIANAAREASREINEITGQSPGPSATPSDGGAARQTGASTTATPEGTTTGSTTTSDAGGRGPSHNAGQPTVNPRPWQPGTPSSSNPNSTPANEGGTTTDGP